MEIVVADFGLARILEGEVSVYQLRVYHNDNTNRTYSVSLIYKIKIEENNWWLVPWKPPRSIREILSQCCNETTCRINQNYVHRANNTAIHNGIRAGVEGQQHRRVNRGEPNTTIRSAWSVFSSKPPFTPFFVLLCLIMYCESECHLSKHERTGSYFIMLTLTLTMHLSLSLAHVSIKTQKKSFKLNYLLYCLS